MQCTLARCRLEVLLCLLAENVHLKLVETAVAAEDVGVATVAKLDELRLAADVLAPLANLKSPISSLQIRRGQICIYELTNKHWV